MPPKSKEQKTSACIAIGIKEGKVKAKPGSPSAEMAKGMTKKQLREYCPKVKGKKA